MALELCRASVAWCCLSASLVSITCVLQACTSSNEANFAANVVELCTTGQCGPCKACNGLPEMNDCADCFEEVNGSSCDGTCASFWTSVNGSAADNDSAAKAPVAGSGNAVAGSGKGSGDSGDPPVDIKELCTTGQCGPCKDCHGYPDYSQCADCFKEVNGASCDGACTSIWDI